MLTFAEHFAGIGLVRLGLEPCGWKVLFANDIDSDKKEMYSAYFQDEEDIYKVDDIHLLEASEIPHTLLATASFPCVDLSIAGNQEGLEGKHSGAFWGFVRILKDMGDERPPLVMLENVTGWLTSNNGKDFREAIHALNDLGYICDSFTLNAKHFVPQSRPRLFVIGASDQSAEGSHDALMDKLKARSSDLHSKRLLKTIRANEDLKWMHLELPEPPELESSFDEYAEALEDDDERWWSQDRVEHILSQMYDRHLKVVKEMKAGDEISYATVYKRMRKGQTRAEVRSDGIAGCLRTPSGGSSKQIVIAAGKGDLKVRWMTAREYARLQGVPDSYPIEVGYIQALWGFGDAVCVTVRKSFRLPVMSRCSSRRGCGYVGKSPPFASCPHIHQPSSAEAKSG